MPSPLPVELNRDRRHEIRVVERYQTDGPFDVDLRNHGDGVHVHVNVAGGLAEVARVAESNPYVEADAAATVRIDVDPVGESVAGELVLATGYGGKETRVDVAVEPFEGANEVPVGEDLAEPQGGAGRAAVESAPDEESNLPVQLLAVAGGAVLLAAAAAVYVDDEFVTVGAGVVVVAALVAVVLSVR